MPSLEEVEKANRERICRWYRFLPSPRDSEKITVMNRIVERFNEYGGFTPELSKKIGW